MNKAVFARIRDIVYEQSGISISEGKESLVESRVGRRLRTLNLKSEEEYLTLLESDLDNEIVALLDVISTNVTHFFREEEHFHHLAAVFREWLQEGQRRFRFWSAASSTGEEPHSIAITLAEVMRETRVKADVRILATDISTRVLAMAREGVFDADRMESVPPEYVTRYFQRVGERGKEQYRARQDIRDMLVVRRMNLSKPPFPMQGPMDVVFCRNVMIYFDDSVRLGLTEEFERLVRPGGYAIIGKSETLVQENGLMDRVGPSIYLRSE